MALSERVNLGMRVGMPRCTRSDKSIDCTVDVITIRSTAKTNTHGIPFEPLHLLAVTALGDGTTSVKDSIIQN